MEKTASIYSTRSLVVTAMFTALLCISAYISIPLPNGLHITLLNFVVILISLSFPIKQSVLIMVAWLLLGIAGIPVFAGGNAGIGYILAPYGGYNIAFIITSALTPILCHKKYNRTHYTIVAVFSVILIDAIGSFWIMAMSGVGFKSAFAAGFMPFIVLDLLKAFVAAQIVPKIHTIINISD